ncbi:nucleotidyl transferase AbiEii/AbiGii toxin family protein [Candidatus Dependentiae bacterium]|nr:nucleotidyl transferase AbiEii/AbiGii toxin family protein [Candidatus Dependentiae bacterium]
MVVKQEILEIAKNLKLLPHIVEKDYVLGWLLAGIAQNSDLFNNWVFKGGTCLKKCYFDSYRMSEDLDFTLKDKSHIDKDFLINAFSKVSSWVYAASGIELPKDRMIFDFYKNSRGHLSCEGRIFYKGPFVPTSYRQIPRIKLDLSVDEIIVESSVAKRVVHPYSDLPSDNIFINCYSYIEIFSEKIRAMTDRTRPRDLYDVIHFFRRPESRALASEVKRVLTEKCDFKKIPYPTYSNLERNKDLCLAGWIDQLSHQVPTLPSFESFWEELTPFLKWLENSEEIEGLLPAIVDNDSRSVVSDLQIQNIESRKKNMLDRIQFACAHHICVEIDYYQENKERKILIIEPYSLRRGTDNSLWIYAKNYQTKEKIYVHVDYILKVAITKNYFKPSCMIDFIPKCQF